MKALVTKKIEVDIKHILIKISPRYIGDSDDDDMPTDTPLLQGSEWIAKVDVETGRIEGWPKGREMEIFAKVCDAGSYYLLDADGTTVLSIENNYVPNRIVPGEYGDYIDLKIGSDGVISNWPKAPSFEDFEDSDDE